MGSDVVSHSCIFFMHGCSFCDDCLPGGFFGRLDDEGLQSTSFGLGMLRSFIQVDFNEVIIVIGLPLFFLQTLSLSFEE